MKRALIIFLCCLSAIVVTAQEPRIQNRPYLDQRFLHYGFFIGLNMMDVEVTNNGYIDPETGEQWYTEIDSYQPGFSVGVLGELRLNKTLGLRLLPTIHFGQKHAVFHEQVTGRDSTQNLKSTYFSLPLELKIAAPRYNNFRPYVTLGAAPSLDLTVRRHNALLTKRFDCFLEIGMGCDIYLPYFKLIPELKFSFGLLDIIEHKRTDLIDASLLKFTESVDKGRAKMISLVFYFE
ncbi:MAG: PorT family protein [Bacteroidales bacterium]|nr:PorT family protein [Bacteroidales bacterium]